MGKYKNKNWVLQNAPFYTTENNPIEQAIAKYKKTS